MFIISLLLGIAFVWSLSQVLDAQRASLCFNVSSPPALYTVGQCNFFYTWINYSFGEWVESSPGEKELIVLVNEKFSVTQQCSLAAQIAPAKCLADPTAWAAGQGGGFCPIPLLWLRPTCSAVSRFEGSSTARARTWWNKPQRRPQKCSEGWRTSAKEWPESVGLFILEKRQPQGDLRAPYSA